MTGARPESTRHVFLSYASVDRGRVLPGCFRVGESRRRPLHRPGRHQRLGVAPGFDRRCDPRLVTKDKIVPRNRHSSFLSIAP